MVDLWSMLETKRTELRRITDQDLSFIPGHFSDVDVCRYLVDAEPAGSAEEAQEIINWCNGDGNPDSTNNRWLIVLKQAGEPIDTVGFRNWGGRNHIAEIGHGLASLHWSRGIIRDKHLFRGEYHDHYLLALLKRGFVLRSSTS